MPDLSSLILTAEVYKVAWNITPVPGAPSQVLMIQTGKSISWSETAENELIHALGSATAIGNENNAYKYTGKLAMQVGEIQTIMKVLGVSSPIKLPLSILGITMLSGTFSLTFTGLLFHTKASNITAKDKESIADMDFSAIDMV